MSEDYWKLKGAMTEFERYWNKENKPEVELHWEFVERLAKTFSYSSLLDVGCGIGNLITFTSLATQHNYIGIDISRPMIMRARVRHPGYQFKVADPMMFTGKFDLVVANGVLLHQHDLFLKLHRIKEFAKTRLIFNVMVTDEGYSKRSPSGYWTRVLGKEEYEFMKSGLAKDFRLEEREFGRWGDNIEYYLMGDRIVSHS